MTLAMELVRRSMSLGAKLWAEGDYLELDAPSDFPDDLIGLLRIHKVQVLAVLAPPLSPARVDDSPALLAWASDLGEQVMDLNTPVTFVEVPLRTVTTTRVSWHAARYLKTIVTARFYQMNPGLCWGQWTPDWWRERMQEALGALEGLKAALEGRQGRACDRPDQDTSGENSIR